jgi:hypothetical protein
VAGFAKTRPRFLANPEQRPHRGGRAAQLVAAQRVQHGLDVGGGDLAEVTAVCCPATDERLDGGEVGVDAGVRAGPGPGVAVEQHQQPGPDGCTAQITSSLSSRTVFGWPDHRPDIFPALITMPRSASRRCSSLAFACPSSCTLATRAE